MRTKLGICFFLVSTHLVLIFKNKSNDIFPYIPPLTHTPGMGLSLIGEPTPPPFLFLPTIQQISGTKCNQCDELDILLQQDLKKGKSLRLQMQQHTIDLVNLLPPETVKKSLLNRDNNEHRIGEVSMWQMLQ
jgi:hypothetical protein